MTWPAAEPTATEECQLRQRKRCTPAAAAAAAAAATAKVVAEMQAEPVETRARTAEISSTAASASSSSAASYPGQIPPSVLSPSSSSGLSRASGAATPTGGLVAPATAAVARKSEAAAARDVWLQHCSSELRLEQLQMLKEETAVNRKKRMPLHDVEHAYYKSSMLSHHSKMLNLRGFFNLFFIVLVVVNASLVTENILTYGCLLQFPRSIEDLSKNWPVLCCFILFQYPFTPCIRWFSVLRHVAESAVCLAMMKIVIDQYIWIVVRDSFSITQLQTIPLSVLVSHFFRQMIRLSIPNLYVWLLMFIGLFHHWCNILAEITRFGDREFYLDWWNASSFGEYWRKWNLPIHFFLHRHVNKPLLRNGVPKFFAACVVFFISALMHEYLVVVPLQLGWTGFIFFAFIGQIPLMYITNIQFLGILLYWYLWGVKQGAVTELDPSRIALS
ncbi:diacylglycerol O-acyltransferase 1C [Cyclospora cayetanensis]|uniref:diacylglycerol O-acyltransferase n=1 Tax=Cyclospora cayetanensis TaxID=88456 RepID=A0A6P6RWU3_9EIME|nr:diacylglycerol O-acyltransferase 1C [Cyclospora cayetanensis]